MGQLPLFNVSIWICWGRNQKVTHELATEGDPKPNALPNKRAPLLWTVPTWWDVLLQPNKSWRHSVIFAMRIITWTFDHSIHLSSNICNKISDAGSESPTLAVTNSWMQSIISTYYVASIGHCYCIGTQTIREETNNAWEYPLAMLWMSYSRSCPHMHT